MRKSFGKPITQSSAPLLVALCCAGILCSLAAGCAPYDWKVAQQRYRAAEKGRSIQLMEVSIRYAMGSPWESWAPILVEPCTSAPAAHLPCWPDAQRRISWKLVRGIDRKTPAYRSTIALLQQARYLNREIGTFRDAWVIGTKPLAVAFFEDRPDREYYARLARPQTGPATGPGVDYIHTRSGEIVIRNRRARHARLVSDADLAMTVNVVLLYPDEMEFSAGGAIFPDPEQHPLRAQVLLLAQPETLGKLIEALAANRLQSLANLVVSVPVRKP